MPAELKLYVKKWCPWCVQAEAYLTKRGFSYECMDVLRDPAAYREMERLSGQSYTPTLVAGGELLADFGTDELDEFLKRHNITP